MRKQKQMIMMTVKLKSKSNKPNKTKRKKENKERKIKPIKANKMINKKIKEKAHRIWIDLNITSWRVMIFMMIQMMIVKMKE